MYNNNYIPESPNGDLRAAHIRPVDKLDLARCRPDIYF